MNTLTFNDVNFNPVEQNGQIWLTASELAVALGYKNKQSVSKIYNSNSDEFTDSMTQVIENTESVLSSKTKGLRTKIRIFSLRGCHLLAMFARTDIAKAFRVWVLDILDRETKSTSVERTALRQACDKLAVGNMLVSDAYLKVSGHYGVEHIEQIPVNKLPEAVAFVYEMILSRQKPARVMDDDMAMNNRMWQDVGFTKTEQVYLMTQELSSLLARVSLKVLEIKDSHSTIFDSFNEQKWNGFTPEQLAIIEERGKKIL